MGNVGQLRRNQILSYSTTIPLTQNNIGEYTYTALGGIKSYESCINLTSNTCFEKGVSYYLKVKVYAYGRQFKIKLRGNGKEMTIKNIKNSSGSATYEIIFTPNDNVYNSIAFEKTLTSFTDSALKSTIAIDKTADKDGLVNVKLEKLVNVIDNLKALFQDSSLKYITKMGLQSAPGFLFSINGEEMRVGKSGVYEIDNISINSLSFVIRNISPIPYKDAKDYFIMDFQY